METEKALLLLGWSVDRRAFLERGSKDQDQLLKKSPLLPPTFCQNLHHTFNVGNACCAMATCFFVSPSVGSSQVAYGWSESFIVCCAHFLPQLRAIARSDFPDVLIGWNGLGGSNITSTYPFQPCTLQRRCRTACSDWYARAAYGGSCCIRYRRRNAACEAHAIRNVDVALFRPILQTTSAFTRPHDEVIRGR